jgi:preprotein translocase subunit YajC
MGGFLILIVILAAVWLIFVMPTRRRRQAHSNLQGDLHLGDEIITAGGLHGTVKELGESELQVEIAPDVVVTLDRRAVAAVAREVEVEAEPAENGAEAGEAEPEPAEVAPEPNGGQKRPNRANGDDEAPR